MRDYRKNFISTERVYGMIVKALNSKKGFSLIRISDGETRVLGHNIFIHMHEIPWWLEYSGVKLPNEKVRQDLISAMKKADVVGLHEIEDHYVFYGLTKDILNYFNIKPKNICRINIAGELVRRGYLEQLVKGRKVVLIGRKAPQAVKVFSKMGALVTGVLILEGYYNIPEVLKRLELCDFDIAIVSAGIPASIICPEIALRFRKIAIDFGHMMDILIDPNFDVMKVIKEWFENGNIRKGGGL